MKKLLLILLIPLLVLLGWGYLQAPKWKITTQELVEAAQLAGTDQEAWNDIVHRSKEELPNIYPFTNLQTIFEETDSLLTTLKQQKNILPSLTPGEPIAYQSVDDLFGIIQTSERSFLRIAKNIRSLPTWGLSENETEKLQSIQEKLKLAEQGFSQLKKIEKVVAEFKETNERVLVLLQNQNEPRSTGGFVGSVIVMDFTDTNVLWEFKDIYSLDRKVDEETKEPSPEFFQELSPKFSLRDANMFPEFAVSSEKIRSFFVQIGEKEPNTIIGINLHSIEKLLDLTGPIYLDKWNLVVTADNFDAILSFLVEAKISGRFNVKDPVLLFAQELLQPSRWGEVTPQLILEQDWEQFWQQKNVLAHSKNKDLQRLFSTWNMDGAIKRHANADNFLYFDFVSVGANKTEKFMWTKIWHDSLVVNSGKVLNTLEIQRRHNLQPNELDTILGSNSWYENIQDQLTSDIRWKLAEGQNRTIVRVWVPIEARIITRTNPSGPINEVYSEDKKFKIFEIPAYVSPGEKNTIKLTYETSLKRGSHNWRPYFMQVVGTPGRSQTSFLETISSSGHFDAETFTIGKPLDLIDNDFRAVVDFREQ